MGRLGNEVVSAREVSLGKCKTKVPLSSSSGPEGQDPQAMCATRSPQLLLEALTVWKRRGVTLLGFETMTADIPLLFSGKIRRMETFLSQQKREKQATTLLFMDAENEQ